MLQALLLGYDEEGYCSEVHTVVGKFEPDSGKMSGLALE